MAKIFRITEAQQEILKKHLKESFGAKSLSPEAEAYYSQQDKTPEPKEEEVTEEPIEQADQSQDVLTTVITKGLEAMGVKPGTNPSSTGTTPSTSPTNTQTAPISKDSTAAIRAAAEKSVMGEELPVSNQTSLTEKNNQGMFDFTSEVDVESYGYEGLQQLFELPPTVIIENLTGKLQVKWVLEIEARSFGVKSFIVVVQGVQGHLLVTYIDETEHTVEKEIPFDPEQLGFKIEDEIEVGSQIFPTSANIDWQSKTITIS